MNYTGLVTPQTKFQSPPMKDKRKHFLVSSYSIVKYKTLMPNILTTPLTTVLNINFGIGLEESFKKMYTFTPLAFVVSELELIITHLSSQTYISHSCNWNFAWTWAQIYILQPAKIKSQCFEISLKYLLKVLRIKTKWVCKF